MICFCNIYLRFCLIINYKILIFANPDNCTILDTGSFYGGLMAFNYAYSKYPLSRVVSVEAIVSADDVVGVMLPHYHHAHKDAWELVLCIENTCRVFCQDDSTELSPEEAYFIHPGTLHDIGLPSDYSRAFVISFCCSGSSNISPLENRKIKMNKSELAIIDQIKAELELAFLISTERIRLRTFTPSEASPLGAEQMICNLLEQLIISFLRNLTMTNGMVTNSEGFRKAVHNYLVEQVNDYVSSRLNENLTVEKIAGHFHYSRSRLSTIYKKATGKGINEYITECRISFAKYLFKNESYSISIVSEKAGFSSPQYFSHVFLSECGITPTEFLKTVKDQK